MNTPDQPSPPAPWIDRLFKKWVSDPDNDGLYQLQLGPDETAEFFRDLADRAAPQPAAMPEKGTGFCVYPTCQQPPQPAPAYGRLTVRATSGDSQPAPDVAALVADNERLQSELTNSHEAWVCLTDSFHKERELHYVAVAERDALLARCERAEADVASLHSLVAAAEKGFGSHLAEELRLEKLLAASQAEVARLTDELNAQKDFLVTLGHAEQRATIGDLRAQLAAALEQVRVLREATRKAIDNAWYDDSRVWREVDDALAATAPKGDK